jgi:hypothetical protein
MTPSQNTTQTTPRPVSYSTPVCLTLSTEDYSCLLSLLPDAFFDLSQSKRDILWRNVFLMISMGKTLEAAADQVTQAVALAANVESGAATLTILDGRFGPAV